MLALNAVSSEESVFDCDTSSQSFSDGCLTKPKPGTFTNSGVATQTPSRRLEDRSGSQSSRSAGVQFSLAVAEAVPPARSTDHNRVMKKSAQPSASTKRAASASSRGFHTPDETSTGAGGGATGAGGTTCGRGSKVSLNPPF